MIQRLIAKRLLQGLVALLIVSIVVFAASRATGNPADLMLPPDASQEQRIEMVRAMGLDRPWPEQYYQYTALPE